MSHRFGSMPFAAEMNPFQSEVGGDQGLTVRWKTEYGAIVADTFHYAIPCARLTANAGYQRFFEKRQSEANIDDKTIPPKRADRQRFSSEQPALRRVHLPITSRAGPAVAASMAEIGQNGSNFRRSPTVTVLKDYSRLPVLGN